MKANLNSVLACTATAALLNFAYPPVEWAILAFAAFVPLMFFREASWQRRFFTGWLAGWCTQASGYFWIFLTIRDFGGQSVPVSLTGAALFWLYQGLDFGIWLWLAPLAAAGLPKWCRPLVLASVWTVLQQGLYPYVFRWDYGAAFASLPVSWSAAYWQSAGVGFLAIALQAVPFYYPPRGESARTSALYLLALVLALGSGVLYRPPTASETWRVGVVQPNLIPWAKQGHLSAEELFAVHYERSLGFLDRDLDLLIWPETALPFSLDRFPEMERDMRELAKRLNAGLVFGAIGFSERGRYTNEIRFFDPGGGPPQVYGKERLVWFSESLPWVFSWARRFDPAIGGFDRGAENKLFRFRGKELTPLVCFEALFPGYAAKRPGHLMINLTNDAWFGRTKASALHLQQIRLRSVESGVPLIRATNSGISCWVDPFARVREAGALYEAQGLLFEVPIPDAVPAPIARWGGRVVLVFSWVLLVFGLGFRLSQRVNTKVRFGKGSESSD